MLSQADWLRGLARCLAHSGADAEDLVQETWVAAMRSPPEPGRPPRPWLAQVMRNLLRMDLRGTARRSAREEEASRGQEPVAASADVALERLELQRMIAAMVKELDEPFRTVILLRFFEGQLPADIARTQGIPAGTVRWRINEGVRRLRQQLDDAHGGRREAWRAVLLPLAGAPRPGGARQRLPFPIGTARWLGVGTAVVGTAVLVLSFIPRAWRPAGTTVSRPAVSTAPTAGRAGKRGTGQRPPAEPSAVGARSGVGALVGVTLPALVAGAQQSAVLTAPEVLDFCIEMRERYLVCKEVLADIRVARVPADKREGSRRMVLQEIVEDGSGPLERRRARCTADLKLPGAFWISLLTHADVSAIRACHAEQDCKNGIACWMNVVEPVVARSRTR